MKRKMKSFVAAFAATTILLGTMPSVAWAAAADKTYDEVAAQNTTFNKYLIFDSDANVPIVNFSYVVEPLTTKIEATDSTSAVLPGVGTPTIAQVSFSTNDNISDTTEDGVGFTGYKQVSKPITVNFSGIKFKEPGIYRYYIYETDDATTGISYDVKKESTGLVQKDKTGAADAEETAKHYYRTLDVYVEDSNPTGAGAYTLQISDYILYDGYITVGPASSNSTNQTAKTAITETDTIVAGADDTTNQPSGALKSDKYINYYDTKDLTIGKRVTGNQGSRDKYFKFTVDITGLTPNTLLALDLSGADESVTNDANGLGKENYVGKNNNKQIISDNEADLTDGKLKADSSGTIKYVCYLKNNQYVTIKGLPTNSNAKYSITEEKEDYDSSYYGDITGATALATLKTYINDGSGSVGDVKTTAISNVNVKESSEGIESEDIEYAFLNTRNGVIPTGIIMSVAPAVGLVLAGLAAAFAVVLGGKRRKEELEEE